MTDLVAEVYRSIGWPRYEEEVLLAIEDALRHYRAGRKGSAVEPLCQVSVSTDPTSGVTAVGFETLQHALRQGGRFVNRPGDSEGPLVELVTYQYPSEFEFRDYHCVYHEVLLPLVRFGPGMGEHRSTVLEWIEQSLLRVREQVLAAGMLEGVPRGPEFWYGINSPRDWYDHVIKL